MEIILKQDIDTLGYANDIVKVRDGYARNYLIPQGMAIMATESNRKQLAETLKQQAQKRARMLDEAKVLAQKIEALTLRVAVKANEEGRLFGTVTTQDIADALKAEGIEIDRRIISVEAIKETGAAEATARLHREVSATIKLNVVAAE